MKASALPKTVSQYLSLTLALLLLAPVSRRIFRGYRLLRSVAMTLGSTRLYHRSITSHIAIAKSIEKRGGFKESQMAI